MPVLVSGVKKNSWLTIPFVSSTVASPLLANTYSMIASSSSGLSYMSSMSPRSRIRVSMAAAVSTRNLGRAFIAARVG